MSLVDAEPLGAGKRYPEIVETQAAADHTTSQGTDSQTAVESQDSDSKLDVKSKVKSLLGLGKKKDVGPKQSDSVTSTPAVPKETSELSGTTQSTTASYNQTTDDRPVVQPSSPIQHVAHSPRLAASPARSQIFERDVQDSTVLQPNSPAIPTHITTENHIPPVLDHASEAITDGSLNLDAVEIVTHSSHQPAAVTVGTASATPLDQSTTDLHTDLDHLDNRDTLTVEKAPNYADLDSPDVRRLSFISFADVVQSEHPGGLSASPSSRDNIHIAGMTTLPSASMNRSPSPVRSPLSSQGPGASPPTSNPASIKGGLQMSPSRKGLGSPVSLGQQSLAAPGGELNIETMSQALRRVGSADLSNARSIPTSPIEPPSSEKRL